MAAARVFLAGREFALLGAVEVVNDDDDERTTNARRAPPTTRCCCSTRLFAAAAAAAAALQLYGRATAPTNLYRASPCDQTPFAYNFDSWPFFD
jgi:hypothetical protein